jgi:uncharacterized membrane protein HdeD (DUF308 family)
VKKYYSIYLYGAIIILGGIFLLFSKNSTFNFIKFPLGIALTAGAILAFIAAYYSQRKQVQFAYHEMHALGMLIYGVSILFLGNTLEKLISFTSFLFFLYSFSEIIFCFILFNLAQKVVYKILIIRVVLGLVVGIGAVVAMNYTALTLEIFGLLFIMVGINIILYVPIMKGREVTNDKKVMPLV